MASSESCEINIPDYKTVREQNIKKINDYYTNLLESYSKDYKDYQQQSDSYNINDRTYAESKIKPRMMEYGQQFYKVNQSLIEKVNGETDLIADQKKELLDKKANVSALTEELDAMKKKDKQMSTTASSSKDSIKTMQETINFKEIINYVLIAINIICILLVIYFLVA